jgi:hypothetical protein
MASDPERGAETPPPQALSRDELLKDLDIHIWGPWRQTAEGDYVFDGPVTIAWRQSRIQADRLSLSAKRTIEAEGNVLVVWEGNRLAGSRLTYDLESETGTVEDAQGQVRNEFLFQAKSAEKIGDKTVRLHEARVTTCTQPTPYWSFVVSSATITIDEYARMWNVRLKAGHLPLIYLPYLLWPVKEDRALGLLLPDFHSSDKLGYSMAQQLFIPLGRSADVTLLGTYYTQAGFGGGGELRFLPNPSGSGRLTGFYIDDKVAGKPRYSATYQQTQQFRNGFRMIADINEVSDFDYYSDYERDLQLVSLPSIVARLEFSRNGKWVSMNARELRRTQLFSDGSELLQQTLPEIEWRGRSHQIGKTPLYLSFESSVASIRQSGSQQGAPIDADYLRADAFPELSLPWTPVPWLDITPRVNYRLTYYTQSQVTGLDAGGLPTRTVLDENLRRDLWSGAIDVVGPKFYRIFGEGDHRYKHAFEPRVSYGYASVFEDRDEVLLFDEVDAFTGAGNQLSYGLTTRLFGKRPRAVPPAEPDTAHPTTPPGEDLLPPLVEEKQVPENAPAPPLESLEIASLELRQARSFDENLSTADLDGDAIPEATSRFSPIQLVGRFNPDAQSTFDGRATYDILHDAFREVSLSGGIRRSVAIARVSFVYRNGLGVRQVGLDPLGQPLFEPNQDTTQIRFTGGSSIYRRKLSLLVDGVYDSKPSSGASHLPERRWRVQYRTQCCAFLLERLNRDYASGVDRSDYYFRVDLSGIGKILDFKY